MAVCVKRKFNFGSQTLPLIITINLVVFFACLPQSPEFAITRLPSDVGRPEEETPFQG